MRSDKKHMDEFFRSKLQEADTDLSAVDLHWDEMKATLATPLPLQPKVKPSPLLLKVAAVVILLAGITFIYISRSGFSNSSDGTAQIKTGKQEMPITFTDTTNTPVRFHDSLFFNFKLSDLGKYANLEIINYVFDGQPVSSFDLVTTATIDSNAIAEEQRSNAAVFSSFFQQLKKRAEEFHIDTQRDTTIRCNEGTVLRIPANSFQTATGLAITGVINMQIQEFYSLADIIGNKLSTTSNGQMLETGGMLFIKAMFNNEEAGLKPGSSLDLSMPAPKFNPEMQLFMGESSLTEKQRSEMQRNSSGTSSAPTDFIANRISNSGEAINWIPMGQQQMFYSDQRKNITIMNLRNTPHAAYVLRPNNPNRSTTVGKFVIPFHTSITTSEMRNILLEKYSAYYGDIKVKRARKPWSKRRQWAAKQTKYWYESSYVGESISIPLNIATRLKYITVEDSIRYENKWKEQIELARKRKEAYTHLLQTSEKYNFKIENLGWINCDYFRNYPAGRMTEFTMVPEQNFDNALSYSMIVFKNHNVAMPCWSENGTIKTQRIPLGEQVTVVSIGVKEGKAFTCVKDLTITREKQQLEFKESSPEDLKEQLARLGRVTSRG